MSEEFTTEEKEALRAQLRNGNRIAQEEIARRATLDAEPTGVDAAKISQVHSRSCMVHTAGICTCAVIIR